MFAVWLSMDQDFIRTSNLPFAAYMKGDTCPFFLISGLIAGLTARWSLTTGLVQRPLVAITSMSSGQFMTPLLSWSTCSVIAIMLSFLGGASGLTLSLRGFLVGVGSSVVELQLLQHLAS